MSSLIDYFQAPTSRDRPAASTTLAGGATVTTPFAQTVIFVRADGGWKALHAHQSTSPRR